MRDQAADLRALVRDFNYTASAPERPSRVYAVAVTSGKGGVGKTSIAVNLALLLARTGRSVRLVDADFGLSNAEVMLGVSPKYGLGDVLRGRIDARDAWVDAPNGVKLLSSGSGLDEMADMDSHTCANLMSQVFRSASDGDIIVLDTAPGISSSVTSVLSCVDEVLMVTTPEPTSITDTYAAIKVLLASAPESKITLVANCCANPAQATGVAKGLESICNRFLGRSFDRYEYLPKDSEVSRAVQTQKPFALNSTHSPASSWLRGLAIKLDERARRTATAMEPELAGVR